MAGFLSDLVQYRRLLLMLVVLGIGGTHLSGFQMSVINYTSPYIQKFINETWLERYGSVLPQETLMLLWSLIVSVYCMGGMIGCLCSGYLTAAFGKKKSLLLNDVVLITAALLTASSRRAKAFEMILAGRFLEGIAAGIHMNAHVQYAGEISPKKLRGFINVTSTVFLALGKTVARILGLRELLGSQALWPLLMASCGLPALVQLLTLPFFPESPPYLLMQKGDTEGCKKAIRQLWGEGQHQAEIDDIMKEKATMENTKILSVLELVKEPAFRWQLYMIVTLTTTIQLSGINAIYFYTFEVLQAAGFDEKMASYMTLSIGLSELLAAVVCSSIIERLGRKVLLRGGYWIMGSLLAAITVTLSLQDWYFWMPYCSLALIILFTVVFAVGPGGATVSTRVEIFKLSCRPPAFVISSVLTWLGVFVIGTTFPFLVERLKHFCFLIFMVVLFTSGMIIHLFLPETKGKSIMEITEEFNKLNFKNKKIPATPNHVTEDYTFCTRL
ncbi:solute carrier family 2, facilitated glucose transporter member 11-like [Camarhynchus parvulus]|uniref:solute carrier family 2, facilitated glucose transporter member 11-like n=1 Tax=Geospiza parvula TaxID=87175 RepID=UPI0012382ED0|nr:solute carrier family 2, facilitated glucose transporter member 11-like [Camarhynchus parvulus]